MLSTTPIRKILWLKLVDLDCRCSNRATIIVRTDFCKDGHFGIVSLTRRETAFVVPGTKKCCHYGLSHFWCYQ